MALYVGVDLHRDWSVVTVLGARGGPLKQPRVNNDSLGDFLSSLKEKPRVVVEATGNWCYPVELMEPHARQVVLAHPKKTKAIASARIKTDKIDSQCLALLLRADLVPTAYIPPQAIRDLRDLLRHRAGLVRVRTQLKNKVHVVLSRYGLRSPCSDLFGVGGKRWLRELADLRPVHREMLDRFLHLVDSLDSEIKPLSEQIESLVEDDTQAQLLCTIPGIGRYSALLILAEIGEPGRFPDGRHLASYGGLVPRVRASGGRVWRGGITHERSTWLRWILIQAVPKVVRGSVRMRALYQRVARRRGTQKAKVAVARELLVVIWHMLRSGQPYQERIGKPH